MNFNIRKIITLLIVSTIFNSLSNEINAQQNSVFSFSIRDMDGESNGKYYHIQIDSISITSDTTLNFQMIPEIEIQDSILKNKYSSFLEMMMRNTNTDISVNDDSSLVHTHSQKFYRWDVSIDYQVIYPYSDLNWVQKIDSVVEAINLSYGGQMFIKHTNPFGNKPKLTEGWNFDYRYDVKHLFFHLPEITKQTYEEFYSDGPPKIMSFDILNEITNLRDINFRISLGFLKTLFLTNSIDTVLVNNDGTFSQDAKNMINLLYRLDQGYNFGIVRHNKNRTPIAIPHFMTNGYSQTNIPLTSLSVDPEGEIVSHYWTVQNGDPNDNTFSITNSTYPNTAFYAQYPGVYTISLEVEDNQGRKNSYQKDIEIFHNGNSPYQIKGVSLGLSWTYSISDEHLREHFKELKRKGCDFVEFVVSWYLAHVDSNRIHPIYYYGGEEDPRGETIPDTILEKYIKIASEEGMNFMLKPVIWIYRNEVKQGAKDRDEIMPRPDFFEGPDGYYNFILHYAQIAEKYRGDENKKGVKIFGVGAETRSLLTQEGTIFWKTLAQMVREIYNGKITYDKLSGTLGYNEWALKHQFFPWEDYDLIGISFWLPIADDNNASTSDMYNNFNQIITDIIRPFQEKHKKPLVFFQIGFANRDGGTVSNIAEDYLLSSEYERDDEEQRRAYDAVFRSLTSLYLNNESWFQGVFWWSWRINNDAMQQNVENKYLLMSFRQHPAEKLVKTNYK